MKAVSILDDIEASFGNLSRQERKIALKVTQKPKQVQSMGIAELAQDVGVSNATVTRFVRKMGCEDYAGFKLQLAALSAKQTDVQQRDPILDSVSTIYTRVLASTWQKLDIEELKRIVKMIKHARRVYVYGLGSSGLTAQEMTQRLIRMGVAAFATTDSHMMFINATVMSVEDLLIVLSNSGRSGDVNEAVALAKQTGVRTVGITGGDNSELAQMVDFPVTVKNSNFVDNTRFVNSQFAAMFVLDIITTLLMKDETFSVNMNRTIQMIMDRKYENN